MSHGIQNKNKHGQTSLFKFKFFYKVMFWSIVTKNRLELGLITGAFFVFFISGSMIAHARPHEIAVYKPWIK